MPLSGIHLLLTYRCVYECDHCFVWGGPKQDAAMSVADVRRILDDATDLGTIEWIWFEGGEPFLYYPVLVAGLREARARGFRTGIVTNGAWAGSPSSATAWLAPLAEAGVDELDISDDLLHEPDALERRASLARRIAGEMGFAVAPIACEVPGATASSADLTPVMFRGRAAEKLAQGIPGSGWESFAACTRENLRDPSRVHIDPYGYVHLCQGLTMGSLWWSRRAEIVAAYDPHSDPVIGALVRGGPAGLVREQNLPCNATYADSCHLCYAARLMLRDRFPERLAPDAMYGA